MIQPNMLACPCCGRPFPPKFFVNGPIRQRIVDLIAERPDGITAEAIFNLVYAADPGGGPTTGTKIIPTHVYFANKRLRPLGYEIGVLCRGRGALYVLRRVNADTRKHKVIRGKYSVRVEGSEPAGTSRQH